MIATSRRAMAPRPPAAKPRHMAIWGVVGVVLGCSITLVTAAPASWLASAVQQASQSRVQLSNARGTLWKGTAQLALSGGGGSSDIVALPGFLEWQLSLRWNGLHVDLAATCCTTAPVGMDVQFKGFSGVQLVVADHQSTWPTSLLVGLGTPWNTLQLQGALMLSSQALVVDVSRGRFAMAGQLQLDATQVSSRLSTLKPMGSYRVTVNGGTAPTLQLQTLEGSLELVGQGQWTSSGLQFDGVATAQPDRIEALSNLLNIIGRRNGARSLIKVGAL